MVTALANGAKALIPVGEISDALAIRRERPDVVLAGEREGFRIRANLSGGVDFDFGNSPREFTPERVQGKTIVITTTNGTRALRACAKAQVVLIGSFLNLRAITNWLRDNKPPHLLLVCSGTYEQAAFEDILAAGAVCERVWPNYAGGMVADSAELARRIYPLMQPNLLDALKQSRNGRRLLSMPALRDDVWFSVQRETISFTAQMSAEGVIRKMG